MKGFVFSLDALMAIFLTSIFVISMNELYTSLLITDTWRNTQLQKQAEDILNVMYNRGDLESLNQTRIAKSLNENLPKLLGAKIQIETYSNTNPAGFVKVNMTYSTSIPNATEVVSARKPFITFYTDSNGDTRIQNESLVKLWIWMIQ